MNSPINRQLFFRIFLILCLTLSPKGQAEDLLEVFQLAHMNDPTLETAKETQLAARENLPQARALFLPVVGGTAIYQSNNNSNAFNTINFETMPPSVEIIPPTTVNFKQTTFTLSLTQPVPYYREWVQYSKANSQVKSANATYAAAEQDLIVRVVQNYFNVLKAYDALIFSKANRKAFAKLLEQSQERFKVGLIAITDVEIARAQHDNALSQEITAEATLGDQKEILYQSTIKPIQSFYFLTDNLKLRPPEPTNVEKWVQTALQQNFPLQASRFGVTASRYDIDLNRAGHLPTIGINANAQRASSTPLAPNTLNKFVNLQVTMPIFNGGLVNSKTRQAAHVYRQTEKQMEVLFRQTERNARQFYRGVITQMNQVAALKQSIISNTSALRATQDSFSVGTRTIVDVLNAQTNLIQAQQNYASARYDYIVQSIQLKQAAGTLSCDDIRHINAWLTKSQKEHLKTALPTFTDPKSNSATDSFEKESFQLRSKELKAWEAIPLDSE